MSDLNKSNVLRAFCAVSLSIFAFAPSAMADAEAWLKYTQAGAVAYREASYGQAERNFRAAVKEAEKFGPKDVRLADSLTNLGVLLDFRGHPQQAEPLFEQAVKIKQNVLGSENPDVFAAVSKLCQFYFVHGNYAKADPLCARIIEYADRKLKENQDLQDSFSKLTNYYQKNPDMEEAEILVKQAEDATRRSQSSKHVDFAVLLDGLGNSSKDAGKLAYSEKLFRRSLSLREQALKPPHMALAKSMVNLADLYCDEGKFALAEPLYRSALDMDHRTAGAQRPETFATMDKLGKCLLSMGKLNDAQSIYEDGLSTYSKECGRGSKYVADCQIALAAVYSRQGKLQQAESLLSEAIKTSERINGPQHASLASLLDVYGDVCAKNNHKAEASKAHARARAIRG